MTPPTPEPRILVCGSVAYDTICVFPGRFGEHVLPDKTHQINVSFMVDNLRREWGGCAGNIAYSLKMLGGEPVVMATIGKDGEEYRARMIAQSIDTSQLRTIPDAMTAQAHIMTDLDDNQITSFHPGAMFRSHENDAAAVPRLALGIVAPDGRDGMIRHCEGLNKAGVPFVFDPGQALPAYSGDDLVRLIGLADYLTVNDYEASMIESKTGKKIEQLAAGLKACIITLGGDGSRLIEGAKETRIPVVKALAVVDPTGCGDTYRSGLLYGIANGWSVAKSAKLASVLGAVKIASRGGQNHQFTRAEVASKFQATFGETLW